MGGDIIGTDKGVYDVSTLHVCYSYLIRECNLPGRACEMVNKLYVMANIAELGVEHARPAGKVDGLIRLVREHTKAVEDGSFAKAEILEQQVAAARAALTGEE